MLYIFKYLNNFSKLNINVETKPTKLLIFFLTKKIVVIEFSTCPNEIGATICFFLWSVNLEVTNILSSEHAMPCIQINGNDIFYT